MSGTQLTPLEAFELNIRDAHHLVRLAEGFTNRRARRMRLELREKAGIALEMPAKRWDELGCIESRGVVEVGLQEGVIRAHLAEVASAAPNKVGEPLSPICIQGWNKVADPHRGVGKGESEAFLERVTERRNKIVHTGDRQGRGRGPLTIAEVKTDLAGREPVVQAIEKVVTGS